MGAFARTLQTFWVNQKLRRFTTILLSQGTSHPHSNNDFRHYSSLSRLSAYLQESSLPCTKIDKLYLIPAPPPPIFSRFDHLISPRRIKL